MSLETQITLRTHGRESFADDAEFGDSGRYERLWGEVEFAVDPTAPQYRDIVDLDLAPARADGRVEYSTDFYMLRPAEFQRGNGRLLFEVINRGTKLLLNLVNDAVQLERPGALEHAGNGYLLRRGYTLLWSGWQGDILPGAGRMTMRLPTPLRDARPVTGIVRTEFAPGYAGTGYFVSQKLGQREGIFSIPLSGNDYTESYETNSLDTAGATLTCREYETDSREVIPPGDWSFARLDGSGATLPSSKHCFLSTGFRRGWIYELIYTAKNPPVLGLGFTGVRDLVSFLRHASHDAAGSINPLREGDLGVEKAYAWGCSQSARYLREFVYRGFNEDQLQRPVFDGINPFVSGAGRITLNYRFAQPGRYPRQHYDHLYASDQFPFAYPTITDPLTGQTDGILKRPRTDPYVIHTQSSSEYWQRRGSLVHTDSAGGDLRDHEKARVYLLSSAEHAANPIEEPDTDLARFPTNPLNVSALQRAMLDNLDAWVTNGTLPPDSRVPTRREDTAVSASGVASMFPSIPNASPPTEHNRLFVQDHGDQLEAGLFSLEPPRELLDKEYVVLLPSVDDAGNEVPGIRGVELEVPTATYTGWNYRRMGEAERSMAAVHGSYLPFAPDKTTRESTGDSRSSLEERYESNAAYVQSIEQATARLVEERLLLEEDRQLFIARALEGFAWRPL